MQWLQQTQDQYLRSGRNQYDHRTFRSMLKGNDSSIDAPLFDECDPHILSVPIYCRIRTVGNVKRLIGNYGTLEVTLVPSSE
jgi:hypothetical protein